MIKLNRTTEYGLMALRHMSRKQATTLTSAREVADLYGLPFEITAKTLQRLRDCGLIHSEQGARGGYTLRRPLREVTLAQFLELMEGPQLVVACAGSELGSSSECEYHSRCEIKHLLSDLNQRVFRFLSGIRLDEITEGRAGPELGLELLEEKRLKTI